MTFRSFALPVALTVLLALLAACGQSGAGDIPVPRQRAYPRPAIYDNVTYSPVEGCDVWFEVNDSAYAVITSERQGNQWLTVRYPVYGATLHATVVSVADTAALAGMTENRLERIGLNSGGASTTLTEFTVPSGFAVRLFSAAGIPTPLQFIAVGRQRLVTGSVMFDNPAVSSRVDSLAPVVGAIEADLLHALRNLDVR